MNRTSALGALFLRKSHLLPVCAVGFGRNLHTSPPRGYATPNQKSDWVRAVNEAEKIVGYPTSFLNLRWLLSDEIANIALHLRKLIGSNHPLLKTTKDLIYNGGTNVQAWGLIVLLVSKAAGHPETVPEVEQDKAAGVMHSQRALAEVTEMMRTSHLVHRGMVNLQKPVEDVSNDMLFGNKIALLSGDYLLSKCCAELANLRNQEITELMSSVVRDMSEAEFVGPRDEQNNPLPAKPRLVQNERLESVNTNRLEPITVEEALGDAESEWTLRNILHAGSLLGKSCQGTLTLAGHPLELQEVGYKFGKHLALAWQACVDQEPFLLRKEGQFSLTSAPVLFHLQYEPRFYEEIEKGAVSINNVDYDAVREAVLMGPGIEKTRELQKKHSAAAIGLIENLPPSDAKSALMNILQAM